MSRRVGSPANTKEDAIQGVLGDTESVQIGSVGWVKGG
jgi:hypothetical protein